MKQNINICRPGFNASCALCCGSHNYRADAEEISRMFALRREMVWAFCDGNPSIVNDPEALDRLRSVLVKESLPRHLDDAIQCPFVGCVDDRRQQVGCLIYGEGGSDPRVIHMSTICGTFSCLARETLTDEEILFAARLTGDWYYYSLLINDIALLREMRSGFITPEDVPEDALEEMKQNLKEKLLTPAD